MCTELFFNMWLGNEEKLKERKDLMYLFLQHGFYPTLLFISIFFSQSNKIYIYIFVQDDEIRSNAAQYLPQISELLNRVPRQMLLLLKTNDLLRGIETTLGTRASSSSFINMSRCCISALAR